jgi:hypothetical protein
MTCTSNDGYFETTDQIPISFDHWKAILAKLKREEISNQFDHVFLFSVNSIFLIFNRLSSNANTLRRSRSRQISSTTKRQDRQSLPRNQVFSDANAESFLGSSSSSSSNAIQSTLGSSFFC